MSQNCKLPRKDGAEWDDAVARVVAELIRLSQPQGQANEDGEGYSGDDPTSLEWGGRATLETCDEITL